MQQRQQVVLVTGASQGIGKATAETFLAGGANVVLAARRLDKLEALAARHPDTALAVACDVCDPDSVDALFARIADIFGRLDVVFNNAGTSLPATEIADIAWQDWRKVLSVNLDGAFLVARGALHDALAAAERRADHQQRLDLGLRAEDRFGRLYGIQARDHRLDEDDLPRWPQAWHRLRSDRHRQRGLRHDRRHADGSAPGGWQPQGRTRDGGPTCGGCGVPRHPEGAGGVGSGVRRAHRRGDAPEQLHHVPLAEVVRWDLPPRLALRG